MQAALQWAMVAIAAADTMAATTVGTVVATTVVTVAAITAATGAAGTADTAVGMAVTILGVGAGAAVAWGFTSLRCLITTRLIGTAAFRTITPTTTTIFGTEAWANIGPWRRRPVRRIRRVRRTPRADRDRRNSLFIP